MDAAILRAAFELFLERGVDGASIEAIAKRAGVGKLTVYRRWTSKEDLLAAAIEAVIQQEDWPATDDIGTGEPAEIIERVLPTAAEVAASPQFRLLVSRVYGCAVSHPALMATYWRHYILPRRAATAAMLRQAQERGQVSADADLEVLIDMLAGAVTYRVLQPNPPDATELRRYLEALHRQVGLLPPEPR